MSEVAVSETGEPRRHGARTAASTLVGGDRCMWRTARRYTVAVAAVAVAVGVRFQLDRWMQVDAPFLLFLAAIVAAAWYGGFGPGLLATALAAAASVYFFTEPYHQLMVHTPDDVVRLGLFLFEALVTCALCASLHRARQRAIDEAERSRELEGAVLEASDGERQRIGQDLHDGLGQQLTGIAFLAKGLERRLDQAHLPEAAAAGQVARLVNETIARTRDVARGLSPLSVEAGGLESALRLLVESTRQVFGVGCKLDWGPGVGIGNEATAVHLYRIAQEAVSNAIRHGKAKNIALSVHAVGGGNIELRAVDDGVGLADDRVKAGTGMGLQIMRYRARMIGGKLEVARVEDGGTVVRCTVKGTG